MDFFLCIDTNHRVMLHSAAMHIPLHHVIDVLRPSYNYILVHDCVISYTIVILNCMVFDHLHTAGHALYEGLRSKVV